MNRYVPNILMVIFFTLVSIAGFSQTAGDYQTRGTGGNWSNNNTWQVFTTVWNNCAPGDYPGVSAGAGVVTILNGDAVTLDVSPANSIGGLNVGTSNMSAVTSLTYGAGPYTLTVTGNLNIYPRDGAAGLGKRLLVNNGTLNVNGNVNIGTVLPGSDNANRAASLNLTTGTITIGGNLILTTNSSTASPAQAQLNITSSGIVNLAGSFTMNFDLGTLSPGTTSTFNFNGSAAGQTIPIGVSNVVYNNLTINNTNAGGATISAAITATNVTNNISIGNINSGSLFNTNNLNVTLGNSKTLTVAANSTMNAGTSVITFGTSGTATINGLIQTANANGFSGSTTTAINSTNTPSITLGTNSTIEYNRNVTSGQTVTDRDYANIIITGTSQTKTWTPTATRSVSGSVTINGTFTIAGTNPTINVGANWTHTSGTFTPNTSTINFNTGTAGNISASNFNNITFSGAGTKTATGILAIAGNVSLTNNFTAGAFTHTVGGNWTNSGTFTATGSTINFNGAGAGDISASNFNNITFSGAGTKTATGILAIAGNVSLTNNFTAGAFTHTVGGNWTNSGTFTATGSTIDFNGANSGNIGASNFNNITFSGAGAKTATGILAIVGNVSLTNNFTAGSFTHTVGGNWTNSGTFTATGSTINFNGANPGNIGASNFNNITFSGAGAKTATGILAIVGNVSLTNNFTAGAFTHTVGGNWTNSGTFTATGSTIDFNGAGAGNISASNFNNITFSGAGTKTATGALTISGNILISNNLSAGAFTHTVSGNFTNNGSFTANTSTVDFNGTAGQAINNGSNSTTFYNLTFSSSGTKTLPTTTTIVNNNFTTTGSNSTTAATNSINVHLNVTLGSSGAFNAGTATHEVWGSWYKNNAGAFTPSTSTIIFTNTSSAFETVGGTQDNTFYNATIDGTTLSLGSNFTVSNILTMNSKLLYLNNLNATLSSSSGLNWTGGGDSYVVTNGSGRFIRTIGAAGTYNFPLGDFIPGGSVIGTDNTRFNPAVMTWGSAPGVTSVSSHFSSAVLGAPSGLTAMIYGGSGATPITSFLNNGYWDFTAVGTTSNYDLTLTTDGVTNMGSLTGMHAIFRNTSTGASGWGLGGGSAAPLNVWGSLTNSTAGFGGVISPQTKNVSQFGFFGIGRSDNAYVLPIVLVAFDGTNVGNANVLSWSTASEINNAFFTIERSLDGQNYEDIGTVEGAGQSSQVLNYTFTDDQPFLGTNYYRLKQTDYNGQFDYSPVISLKVTSSFEMGYPYPNPVNDLVSFNISSQQSGLTYMRIMDVNGRIVYEQRIAASEGMQTLTINMEGMPAGMYISEITIDGAQYRKTILKQ